MVELAAEHLEKPKVGRGKLKDKREVLQELRDYIESLGGTYDGRWDAEIKVRTGGVTAGSQDVYYLHPTVKRLRSKLEVARHLNLAPSAGKSTPKKKAATPAAKPGSSLAKKRPTPSPLLTTEHTAPSDAPRSAFKRPKVTSRDPLHTKFRSNTDRTPQGLHKPSMHLDSTSTATATLEQREQLLLPEKSFKRNASHPVRPSDASRTSEKQRSSMSAATHDPLQQHPHHHKRWSTASESVFGTSHIGSQKTPRTIEAKAPVPKFPASSALNRSHLPDNDRPSVTPESHPNDATPRMSTTGAALRTSVPASDRGMAQVEAPRAVARTTDAHTKPGVDESQAATVALASLHKALSGLAPLSPSDDEAKERKMLAQQAQQISRQLKVQAPMRLPHGVVLQRLGKVVEEPGFHKYMHLSPPGHLSWWQDEAKSVTIFFIVGTRLQEAKPAAAAGKSADPAPSTPKKRLVFTIAILEGSAKPPPAGARLAQAYPNMTVLAKSSVSPSDAFNQLLCKRELAKALHKDSSFKINPPSAQRHASAQALYSLRQVHLYQLRSNPQLLNILQEMPMPPVRWPKLLFGLSHPAVIAALEGQEAVEKCSEYQYVEARRGWEHEQKILESELHMYEAQAFKDGRLPAARATPGNPYIQDPKAGLLGANNMLKSAHLERL